MSRIIPKDLDELKTVIRENNELHPRPIKNFYSMNNYFDPFIKEGRLSFEIFDEGLLIYIDENRYDNVIFFLDSSREFPGIRGEKDFLIEVQTTERMPLDESLIERILDKGFSLAKDNMQLEMDLKLHAADLERNLDKKLSETYDLGYSVEMLETEALYEQAVHLWTENLEVVDVPYSHMRINPEEKVVGVLDHDGRVVASHWWRNTGRFSEGRHTVTDKAHTRKGLASLVLLYWYCDALRSGCDRAIGWAEKGNYPSIQAQEKLGATPNGKECKQYMKMK